MDRKTTIQTAMRVHQRGDLEAADRLYSGLLAEDESDFEANRLLGVLRYQQQRFADACLFMKAALRSCPASGEVHSNLALTLERMGRIEDAIPHHDRAVDLLPSSAPARNNRAIALKSVGLIDEAEIDIDRALMLDPEFVEAHLNRSVVRLLKGDLLNGWIGQEKRWAFSRGPKRELVLPFPKWVGQDIRGKTIIAYQEQGFGDILQFSRFLPALSRAGASVTFYVHPSLRRLFRAFDPEISVIDIYDNSKQFDYQSALMSLPAGFRTVLETIPTDIPYLAAEPQLIEQWRKRIGIGSFNVGLCCQTTASGPRSIPIQFLDRLLTISNIGFVSLQKEYATKPDCRIKRFAQLESEQDAFVETAAAISCLDLVITCDTAIAHLAGALGRRVWTALPLDADWRWMLGRRDSPWYPTMTLYRQASRGATGATCSISLPKTLSAQPAAGKS